MGFIFEGLLGGTITLAGLYVMLSVYVYRKLLWVQANTPSGLNTRKLFVMTVMLVAVVRAMSFLSMTLLALGSVDFQVEEGTVKSDDDGAVDGDKDFFNKAMVALFDFPDFYFVSAYVLQVIVWAETYLKSRRHWLSAQRFQRVWVWAYFVFNVLLYCCQIALYSLLFLPDIDHYVETDLIYLTLAGFNLVLPVCWIVLYFYLTLQFSGFPHSTPAAMHRLTRLSRLVLYWTCTRLAWGIVALSSVLQDWITEVHKSPTFYTIVLICIFVVVEICPIYVSLKRSSIQLLADSEEGVRASSTTPATVFSTYVTMEQHSPLLEGLRVDSTQHDDGSSVNSDQFHPARQSFTNPRQAKEDLPSVDRNSLLFSDRDSDGFGSAVGDPDKPSSSLWDRINVFGL